MIPPVLEQSTVTPVVNGNCLSAGGIRLNLGGIGNDSNEQRIPGFLTVDLQDTKDTDIVSDISKLTILKDGTVDEIYCSNALEHFPHIQTVDVLKEWFRVLKKGSNLWISVPDMDAAFRLYKEHGLTQWVINLIWGDQFHAYAYHYVNFTFATLAKCIYDAGFSDVRRITTMPFGIKDASGHRDSIHMKLISLNVVARK